MRPRVGPAAGCGRGVLVSLKMSQHMSRPIIHRHTQNPHDAIMWWMHSELAYQLDDIKRCKYASVGYHSVVLWRLVKDEAAQFNQYAKGRMYQKHWCSASEVMWRLCQMSTAVLLRTEYGNPACIIWPGQGEKLCIACGQQYPRALRTCLVNDRKTRRADRIQ